MERIIISLVGEQPAPNVLPIDYFNPNKMILVHTSFTEELAERIGFILNKRKSDSVIEPFCATPPYDISKIQKTLNSYLSEFTYPDDKLIFNLTGGTKTMGFAAMDIAKRKGAKAFYFQTGTHESLIHPYRFENGQLVCENIVSSTTTMTLAEYLQLYLGEYESDEQKKNSQFELNVFNTLKTLGDDYEVTGGVYPKGLQPNAEIDFILRYRHTVAIGEIKESAKKGTVQQLMNIANQRRLGTYITKFIIHTNQLDHNNEKLMEAHHIIHIRLPDGKRNKLTEEDKAILQKGIRTVMEPQKRKSDATD